MLTNITGRNNNLSLRDIVILQENDLQEIANIWILVDDRTNIVDEMNNSLGHPVPRCSLSTEDGDSGGKLLSLLGSHSLDIQVPVDDSEYIHLLTLILMYTLHLDVEKCRWIDGNAGCGLDVLGKSDLIGILDFCPLLLELLVISILLEVIENIEIFQESKTASFACNKLRQSGVGLVQPTSWCDSVRDVRELIRSKDLDKVLENGSLDQIRMKFSDTVDLVGTDNSQESHANHFWLGLFDDRNASQEFPILWELALHSLQEIQVDLVDDLQMSWKQVLEQWYRPLLQRLGEDSMIRVSELGEVSTIQHCAYTYLQSWRQSPTPHPTQDLQDRGECVEAQQWRVWDGYHSIGLQPDREIRSMHVWTS